MTSAYQMTVSNHSGENYDCYLRSKFTGPSKGTMLGQATKIKSFWSPRQSLFSQDSIDFQGMCWHWDGWST